MEGPEAAYVQSDLYADVMTNQPMPAEATPNLELFLPKTEPFEYKSYTTVHPKSVEQQEKEAKIAANVESVPRGKQLYVGNLTWWTNDDELSNAIQECGVTDLISVKFFENRINGQSKGFALVEVNSDTSMRLIMDRLPNQTLHNQKPIVTAVSKQNLQMFEQQARKDKQGGAYREEEAQPFSKFRDRDRDFRERDRADIRVDRERDDRDFRRDRRERERSWERARMGLPPGVGQPQIFGAMPGAPMQLPPQMLDPSLAAAGLQPQFQIPGAFPAGSIIVDALGNVIQGPMPGLVAHGLHPGMAVAAAPQFAPRPGAAPHVNPAFIPADRHPPPIDPVTGLPLQTGGLNEQDMESMRRNQAVASTAIQRAMADANAGDFENGIETLVTAISLINQSTTAGHEAAQVLVQSLQDCLHGLESQLVQRGPSARANYSPDSRDGSRERRRSRRERSNSRSRSRSRDRGRDRDRDRKRSSYSPGRGRSRSRSRDRERRRR